jgi:hypothetical protein
MARNDYVALDGYTVDMTTTTAIGLRVGPLRSRRPLKWVPRSLVEGGDDIVRGDTDIRVQAWFAEREGLET